MDDIPAGGQDQPRTGQATGQENQAAALNLIAPEEEVIRLDHLPGYTQKRLLQFQSPVIKEETSAEPTGLREQLAAFEKRQIGRALSRHKGSVTKAALALGRQNLHHKIKKYALAEPGGEAEHLE